MNRPDWSKRAGRYMVNTTLFASNAPAIRAMQSQVLILEAEGVPADDGGMAVIYLAVCDLFDEFDGQLTAAPFYALTIMSTEASILEAEANPEFRVQRVGDWAFVVRKVVQTESRIVLPNGTGRPN